ncbi:hypothetical protein [Flavicella sp.]|uniref:hypothetical protein n=1 Tax=Flavicella sp. TaxID=2957742 RepID=UPI00262F251D|nr:hypothetical protein [Flavicella sp.]MDG1805451.1 hypothetical protein [Flavicella sp.]
MRKIITGVFAILLLTNIGCKSNGEETAIAPGDDLDVLGQKLELLETSFISTPENNTSAKFSPKNAKKLAKKLEECEHEFSEELIEEDYIVRFTQKLYDGSGNAITDCQLGDILESASTSASYAVGTNYYVKNGPTELDYDQYTKYSFTIKPKLTTATYTEKVEADISALLKVENIHFNFLEGSYLDVNRSYEISMNMSDEEYENTIANSPYQIDLKYILSLDANGNDYHFELILNQDDLSKSKIEKTYPLYNVSNQKVGTVKYTLYSSGKEVFKVYDLDNNLMG